jgi:hypothetical protein
MPFYYFNQNNSGGRFTEDPKQGLAHHVIIEADSAKEANDRAEAAGLYFDGIAKGHDCDCCGDRWSPVGGAGDASPMVYGEKVLDWQAASDRKFDKFSNIKWMQDAEGYIHYKDGSIVGFWTSDRTAQEKGGKW